MTDYTTLFEQQSYQDALEYYLAVLSDDRKPTWDYVLLTASNEAQAKAYTMQIKHRLANGQLPGRTHYAVIPDRNGQRIGSGGRRAGAGAPGKRAFRRRNTGGPACCPRRNG